MNGLRKCLVHTMEYYSVIKRNEIMSLAGKWMELEIIILGEVSQLQKDNGCMLSVTKDKNVK
jgi:hypothetical protein